MAARGFALEWLPAKRIIVAIELITCIRRSASLIRNLDEHCERVNALGRHILVTLVNCPAVRFPSPASRLPAPGSRFLFPVSRSLLPASCFQLSVFCFPLSVVPGSGQQATGSGSRESGVAKRETGDGRQETGAGWRLATNNARPRESSPHPGNPRSTHSAR
jgi:hypothetical protein